MWKRFLTVLLIPCLVLTAGLPASLAAEGTGFADVDESAWYYEAVLYSQENGLMSGLSDTSFGPEVQMSRSMLVATLYRAAGEPVVSQSSAYTDVPSGAWYYSAVAWAATNEIVSGYADGSFGSDDPVSREQLVTILWRYAGSPSASADPADRFADQSQITAYATEAVAWARVNGIITGKTGNRFDPQGNATRAEVAVMLQRFLSPAPNAPRPVPTLQLTVGDQQFTLTLEDNAVTRDLVSRLPLTLTFADYARAEKVAYLPGDRLDTVGVAGGYDPQVGDLCLYAPWGNLCFFYENAAYNSGLIHLGVLSAEAMAVLAAQDTDFEMTMEIAK